MLEFYQVELLSKGDKGCQIWKFFSASDKEKFVWTSPPKKKKHSRRLRISEFSNRNPRRYLNHSQSSARAKQKLWSYHYTLQKAFDNYSIYSTSYFDFINMFIFVPFQFIIYL